MVHRSLLSFVLIAGACGGPAPADTGDGSTDGTDDGDADSTGDGDGDSTGDGDPSGDGDGDGDPSGDGDGDPSGDGDGEPSLPPELPAGLCMTPELVHDVDAERLYVYEEGQPSLTITDVPPSRVSASDQLILTMAKFERLGVWPVRTYARDTGELLFESLDFNQASGFIDGLDRIYLGQFVFGQMILGMILDESLEPLSTGTYLPIGPLTDAGWLPVLYGAGYGPNFPFPQPGFFWPQTQQVELLPVGLVSVFGVPGEDRIDYLDVYADQAVWSVAEPGQILEIPLPALDGLNGLYGFGAKGSYRIAHKHDTGPFGPQYRVDVAKLEALLIEPVLPDGWTRYACDVRTVVDADGRLMMGLYDGEVVQTFAWDPATNGWETLGPPLAGIGSIWLSVHGGRVVQIQTGSPDLCREAPDWGPPPPEAVVGESAQLTRLGAVRSLPIDPDDSLGPIDSLDSCVAWRPGSLQTNITRVASLDDLEPPVELTGEIIIDEI